MNGASGLENVKTNVGSFTTATNSPSIVQANTCLIPSHARPIPLYSAPPCSLPKARNNADVTRNQDTFEPASPAPANAMDPMFYDIDGGFNESGVLDVVQDRPNR